MRSVFVIARKDLRQRLRDCSAIVLGLVAPLTIAALMSFAFKGTESFHFTLGVVDSDHGPVASALIHALESPASRQIVTVKMYLSESAARAAVRNSKASSALVIPAGFSTSVTTNRPESLTTVTNVNNLIATNVTQSIATSYIAQLNADRLSVFTALGPSPTQGEINRLAADAATLRIPIQAVEKPVGAHQLTAISYFAPAMAIFFLLFIINFTARSFFVDRAEGMIERMRAAPVRPLEILAGKALSVFVYGLFSLATVAVITSAVFGAHWGNSLAVSLLLLAMVISVVCMTALVIGVSRTQRQAEGFVSILTFGLALLGGNFIFISSAPPLMRHLALFTPNGWALRGITSLATIGGGPGSVVSPILAMLAFSVVIGGVAASLANRAVSS